MRKIILIIVVGIVLISCSTTRITSNTSNPDKKRYNNFLITIFYTKGSWNKTSTENLTKELAYFVEQEQKMANTSMIVVSGKRKKISLNDNTQEEEIKQKMADDLSKDNYDLFVLLEPTDYTFHNNALKFITYSISALDLESNREVWKASFVAKAGLFASAKNNAKVIYTKMKSDGLLD